MRGLSDAKPRAKEDGMQAVATVVMNRVRVPYGEYQRLCLGNLRRVIEQLCQFSCYKTVIAGLKTRKTSGF